MYLLCIYNICVLGGGQVLVLMILYCFIAFRILLDKEIVRWTVSFLRGNLVFFYFALYSPVMECFVSMFKCENGMHFIDNSLQCFQSVHIAFILISILFLIFTLLIAAFSVFFFNHTHQHSKDALSR